MNELEFNRHIIAWLGRTGQSVKLLDDATAWVQGNINRLKLLGIRPTPGAPVAEVLVSDVLERMLVDLERLDKIVAEQTPAVEVE